MRKEPDNIRNGVRMDTDVAAIGRCNEQADSGDMLIYVHRLVDMISARVIRLSPQSLSLLKPGSENDACSVVHRLSRLTWAAT